MTASINVNIKYAIVAITLIFVLFVLVACGRNRAHEANNGSSSYVLDAGYHYTYSFVIAVPSMHEYFIQDIAERVRVQFANYGKNIIIEITSFDLHDTDQHMYELYTQLYEGHGPDVFMVTPHHPMFALIESGLLADINEIIYRNAYRGDFFYNVLDALEINGNLYTFPASFVFDYVGINANLPEDVIQRFAQYDAITFEQLVNIYNDLQSSSPELEHLAMAFRAELKASEAIHDRISANINWQGKRYLLTPSLLASFLDEIRPALYNNDRYGTMITPQLVGNPMSADMLALQAERYVFAFTHPRPALDTANALLSFDNPHFVNYIPLASEDGRLMATRALSFIFSVSATSNEAIAMAFLQQAAMAMVDNHSLHIPIIRDVFHIHVEDALTNAIYEHTTQPSNSYTTGELIDMAKNRLEGYLSMNVSVPISYIMFSATISENVITTSLSENQTTIESAAEIWELLNYWLLIGAEIGIDSPWLQDRAILADRAGLPVRTLSVMAPYELKPHFSQATLDMNLAWAEREENYFFSLDMTTYTVGEREMLSSRIATMMMAGIQYDMFTIYNGVPLWNWADTGLLTDVWGLIDANPDTKRADFYTNILDAFTYNGGLWAFPLSFGFQYMGINTSLPQSFVDRFSMFETISIRDAMHMFTDLITEYRDEFGHMLFSFDWREGIWGEILLHEISSYVDFNTRRSNLIDESFISFLYALRQAYPVERLNRMHNTMLGAAVNLELYSAMSGHFMFNIAQGNFNSAYPFITMNNPYFGYYLPLTDDVGRLRIRHAPHHDEIISTWATLVFPLAGDSALAWEFTQHLINSLVFTNIPSHAAGTTSVVPVGRESVATPIIRELFVPQIFQSLEHVIGLDIGSSNMFGIDRQFSTQVDDSIYRELMIESALERLAAYNEMSAVLTPFFPSGLNESLLEILDDFMRGIITAEAAAQQMHNRVSLWLIE